MGFFLFCLPLGLLLGPLCGVFVDRTVEKLPFKFEHRCVSCKSSLKIFSVTPVYHWFFSCSVCKRNKGYRYIFIDIFLIAGFWIISERFTSTVVLFPYFFFIAVSVILAAIDLETYLLPNKIVWPFFYFSLFSLGIVDVVFLSSDTFLQAIVGSITFSTVLFLTHLVYPAGMGFGDVKLALSLGLYIGFLYPSYFLAGKLSLYAVCIAFLGAAPLGIFYNILVHRKVRGEVPFGPFLILGTVLVITFSPHLVSL